MSLSDTVKSLREIAIQVLLPIMGCNSPRVPRRFKHVFLDAEGTLYVPRNGKSWWDFWIDPSPDRALYFFELDRDVVESLAELREQVDTLCIVSFNKASILTALLRRFGISGFFDDILLNGDKGSLIEKYLGSRGMKKEDAVMVGDMPDLDMFPVRRVGVEAILVDRPYNRWAKAERITGIRELPAWLRIAGIAEPGYGKTIRSSTLDDYCNPETATLVQGSPTKSLIAEGGESGLQTGRICT